MAKTSSNSIHSLIKISNTRYMTKMLIRPRNNILMLMNNNINPLSTTNSFSKMSITTQISNILKGKIIIRKNFRIWIRISISFIRLTQMHTIMLILIRISIRKKYKNQALKPILRKAINLSKMMLMQILTTQIIWVRVLHLKLVPTNL